MKFQESIAVQDEYLYMNRIEEVVKDIIYEKLIIAVFRIPEYPSTMMKLKRLINMTKLSLFQVKLGINFKDMGCQ